MWHFETFLSGNRIQQLNGFQSSHFENLVTLELRGNQLDTTAGINLPNLQKLYLVISRNKMYPVPSDFILVVVNAECFMIILLFSKAKNVIKRLEGLEKLEHLTVLHLRNNQLESLDGLSPSMKCLRYLNVRYTLTLWHKKHSQCGVQIHILSEFLRSLKKYAEVWILHIGNMWKVCIIKHQINEYFCFCIPSLEAI